MKLARCLIGKKGGRFYGILISVVLSAVFLLIFYKPIVLHPNQHMFTASGDGVKNYYTYAWHIKYDSSYNDFEGMNYPYGELHQFTDGQPILSNVLKFLSNVFPNISDYSIGILNLFLLFSFLITAFLLTLILIEFKIPPIVSGIIAFAIMTLAPQIHRFGGHFSLGYYFAFPMVWYAYIRYLRSEAWLWTIFLFLINLVLLFTHPYLCIINIAFLIASFVWRLILEKKAFSLKKLLHLFVHAFLPVLIWMIYIKLFDHHSGRPDNMFSFNGLATFPGILLPPMGALKAFLNELGLQYQSKWESWSYLGLFNLFVIVHMIFRCFQRYIRERKLRIFPENFPKNLKIFWISSFFVLLYAFGIPYTIGFDFLLEWFPPLQQIRAVARFAWVFFYVSSVGSIVYVYYEIYQNKNRVKITYLIWTFAIFIMLFEGVQYHKTYKPHYLKSQNVFSENADDALTSSTIELLNKVDVEKYQTILPLPYYHIGSGIYQLDFEDQSGFLESLVFSYHSGLPLMSVVLSRTSLIETRELLCLFNPPYMDKPVVEKMNDEPILLMVTDESKVRLREKWLLERAEIIVKGDYYDLYELPVSAFFDYDYVSLKKEINKLDLNELNSGQIFTDKESCNWFFKGVNGNLPTQEIDTNLVFSFNMHGYNNVVELPGTFFCKNEFYELSFWFYNPEMRLHTNMFINEVDKDGKENWTNYFSLRRGLHIGDWTLVDYCFKPSQDLKNVRITFHYKPETNVKIYYTDFLLRPINSNVYCKINDTLLMRNNQRIELPLDFWK